MLKFTKKGKIEVRKGGALLSSHTTDTEAYEKISSHSDANGPAKYVVSYPTVEVDAMPITIVSKDTQAPTQPPSFTVTAPVTGGADLAWGASTDGPAGSAGGSGLEGYEIWRALWTGAVEGPFSLLTFRTIDQPLTYNDPISPGTKASYFILARDNAKNRSTATATIAVTAIDTTAPTQPVISAVPLSTSVIEVRLITPSTDTGSGVASYTLQYKQSISGTWTTFATNLQTTDFPKQIPGLASVTAYDTRLEAIDGVGNHSTYGTASATTNSAGGGGGTFFGATLPAAPALVDTTYSAPSGGTTWTCANDAQWLAAIAGCALGDTIVLSAGVTYTLDVTPRNLVGTGWVYIISNQLAQMPVGRRITKLDAQFMPRIRAVNLFSAMTFTGGAHHYRFAGVEFAALPGAQSYGLVQISGDTVDSAQTPHHLIWDRCYIHGDRNSEHFRGLNVNGKHIAIVDCNVSDFCSKGGTYGGAGQDTQGILSIGGYGPLKVDNTYVDATGENIMIGGGNSASNATIMSDVRVTNSFLTKPGYMDDIQYISKNIFETKLGRRVVFDSNHVGRNRTVGQNSNILTLTVRDQHDHIGPPFFPGAEATDVQITNNRFLDVTAFATLSGNDVGGANAGSPGAVDNQYIHVQPSERYLIRNNLVEFQTEQVGLGVNRMGIQWNLNYPPAVDYATGLPVPRQSGADWIHDHNTFINKNGNGIIGVFSAVSVASPPATQCARFIFTNNIVGATANGFNDEGQSNGGVNAWIARGCDPASKFVNNAHIDISASGYSSSTFPAGNFFPANIAAVQFANYAAGDYSLAVTSPYKTAGQSAPGVGDGSALGCNMALLPPLVAYYSTSFRAGAQSPDVNGNPIRNTDYATQAPINENGRWVNGLANGLQWNNVNIAGGKATASRAMGSGSGADSRYADNLAIMAKNFSNDQFVEATVSKVGGYTGNGGGHEIELLLRFNISANNAHGYEVLWGISGYLAVVRWNGANGDYTPIYDPGAGSAPIPQDGDVFCAEIRGNKIRVAVNNVVLATVDVTSIAGTVWASGHPGIGFWPVDGAIPTSLGFRDVTCMDMPQ